MFWTGQLANTRLIKYDCLAKRAHIICIKFCLYYTQFVHSNKISNLVDVPMNIEHHLTTLKATFLGISQTPSHPFVDFHSHSPLGHIPYPSSLTMVKLKRHSLETNTHTHTHHLIQLYTPLQPDPSPPKTLHYTHFSIPSPSQHLQHHIPSHQIHILRHLIHILPIIPPFPIF